MLQRMQAEGDETGGVLDTDHAENAAFLAQLVVVEGMGEVGHARPGQESGVI